LPLEKAGGIEATPGLAEPELVEGTVARCVEKREGDVVE
jgi:hypothetical protein